MRAPTKTGPGRVDAPLRIRQCFRWEVLPPDGVCLLSETQRVLFRGEGVCDVVPLLDGTRSIEDIFAELSDRVPPERVFSVLDRLRSDGYLADGPIPTHAEEAAFWELSGTTPRDARLRLQQRRVAVAGQGGADPAPLVDLLVSMGVDAVHGSDTASPDLWVVVVDDYLRPPLAEVSRRSLASGRPMMLVKPVGIELWIGPLFVPGQTGCWACLAHRLRGHRRLEGYLRWRKGTDEPFGTSRSALRSTRQVAVAMAATEVAKWAALDEPSALAGTVVTLNALTLEQRTHILTRRPQCPECGQVPKVDPRAPAPIVLERRPAQFRDDGGHRVESPGQTVARMDHHISPITGIVGSLRPLGEGEETSTFVADHAFVDIHLDRYALHEGLRKRSGGKGVWPEQARAGAIGEALERYSGVFDGDEPRLTATRTELGPAAMHPNTCMGYSERQYATRERWNAKGSRVHWVPEPFEDATAIEWTPLWSLTAEEPRYLPTSYCYYGYPGEGARFCAANSNGCAAGNTIEEAILQGLLELVERDAVALWWYNRVRRPAVELTSFGDPYVERLLERYEAMARELWVVDITSDLGIPTCAAVSRRKDSPAQDIVLGFGAHLDARLALLRALTEVSQSLPAVPGRGAAPRYAGSNPEALVWWRTATIEDQPYLGPDHSVPATRRADYPALANGDLREDVLRCVRIVAEHGMETLVLDQSRPDVGLHVVRVVVPGLRHFWARFGAGRLYDVPVEMGWRKTPLDETELNPWVVYF